MSAIRLLDLTGFAALSPTKQFFSRLFGQVVSLLDSCFSSPRQCVMVGTTPHSFQRVAFQRRLEMAQGYLLLEMPEQALRELSALRGCGAESAEWHRLRGEAFRSARQHAEALVAFEQADSLDPDDVGTLMGIAWCQKRTDRLPDAIDTMLRAYRACPREPIVLYNIACYFCLGGEKRQALSWLGRALRMSPELRELIPEETDFDSLRDDADFQLVIENPIKRDIC